MDYILSILHKMLLDLAINHRFTSQEIIWIWGSGFNIKTIIGRLDASNPYFAPVIQVCNIYQSVEAGSLSVSDGASQALAISEKPVVVEAAPAATEATTPVETVETTDASSSSTTAEETASTTEASDTKASE